MSNLVRLIQSPHHEEQPGLHVRVAILEDRMEKTMQNLATKAELKEVEGALRAEIRDVEGRLGTRIEETKTEIEKVRTDLEKGQKENRAWLLTATVAIIGVMIAVASFFGYRDTQVVYAPQEITSALANTAQELKELRERLVEAERTNVVDEPSD